MAIAQSLLDKVGRLARTVKDLKPLIPFVDQLTDFARNPYQFLRKRLLPVIFGGIFSLTFNLADAIARPFAAIANSLQVIRLQVGSAIVSVFTPINNVITEVLTALRLGTSGLGPLQPFLLVGLGILMSYVLLGVAVRAGRAIMDAIPVLSGLETFLFG